MIEDTDTSGSDDNSSENGSEAPDPIKSKLEALESQNAEMMQKLNSFLAAQSAPKQEPEKRMTASEFKELMEKDPESAIGYAMNSKVTAKTQEIERSLTLKQQAQYYDQKVEQDFPLINKDRHFQKLVSEEANKLINAGMPKDAPQLVFLAAEKASFKYKGAEVTKAKESKEVTSEAPSNIKRSSDDVKVPKNAEMMFKAFGMSDKAKEIYKRNLAAKSADDDRRKGKV